MVEQMTEVSNFNESSQFLAQFLGRDSLQTKLFS